MYNFDHSQPGSSRQPYYNDNTYSFYSDFVTSNSNKPGLSAADRLRESHRSSRQYFNTNFHTANYRHNPWVQVQNPRGHLPIQNHANFRGRLSTQYQPKDKRDHNKDKTFRPNQQHKKNKNPLSINGDTRQQKPDILSSEIDYKLYNCPNCVLQFECSSRYNSYIGRVPLVLNCKHTVCQECIPKIAKSNTVLCPVCKNPSVLPPRYSLETLQNIFFPNFYLIGFIMWCKSQGTNPNFMSLVPVGGNTDKKSKSPVPPICPSQTSLEICCYLSCNKIPTLQCQDCSDVYCQECCTRVHKNAKPLWSHKQVAIVVNNNKPTFELGKCPEHNMDLEFYCTSCKTEACCYCFIEQHEGHVKENLAKLSDAEMEKFQSDKENARKILRQLLISQRQLKELYSGSTINIEKKISNFFMNLHAKLQCIEKNLKKDVVNYSSYDAAMTDIDDLHSTITTSVNSVKNIVLACDALEIKKMNLREMAKRLDEVQGLHCYLLSDSGKGLEPLEFDVKPCVDGIEECFTIKKNEKYDFKLVSEDNLPLDYEKESVDPEYESDIENSMNLQNNQSPKKEDGKSKKKFGSKPAIGSQVALEHEMVEVTHIESLECFYVQLKKTQYQFSQMNRNINDYIKMGAPTVDHPQLNEIYLVMYQTKDEKIWCRGRVTEIKNGEMEPMYEVFFIDYGSTQTVDLSKLRQITADLAYKKPFAVHCELYTPAATSWGKNAHVYMGKMINGKQVSMLVKRMHSGVHEVDLMVMSSDRGQTSIIDILLHTCSNPLNTSSDNESVSSQKLSYNRGFKIYANSADFKKYQQEKVILVNVIDPHHIFVHIADHSESFKKLSNVLRQTFKNSKKNMCLPVEGTYVIVESKDPVRGNWHRALIKKVDLNSEQCQVLLIDWGLNIIVSWSSIRMIQEEFTRLESQAVLVKLAHIEPLGKDTQWLHSATVFLEKYYRSQEVMKIIVHKVDPLEVALFEVVGEVDVCINAQLVSENFAESTGKISQTLEWPRNNSETKGFTDEDGLVATLLKQVDQSIGDDSEEEKEDKNVARQKIEVVKFVNPDLIYIKFPIYELQEMTLNKELQIHYSKEHKTKESWEVDDLCVVLHNLSYVRAKILEKVGNKKYRVNIYDRGVEAVLPLEKMFEFAKYFNKFPNVVFKSHLANIRPAGGDKWSLSSIEALERMFDKYKDIYGIRVEGDITGKSIPLHMWYTQIKMGGALEASITKFISLNNLLVKLGFAYKVSMGESVKSTTESVNSGKSSKSNKFKKPNRDDKTSKYESTTLLSAIEKLAIKSDASDIGTDQESTKSDSKDKDLPESDNQGDDASAFDSKDEIASIVSSQSSENVETKIIFEEAKITITDWNELIEVEEEDKIKETDKNSERGSPYRIQETEIEDWIPAFPIKETEFYAWITCAETEGILYLREEKLQNVYKEMEENIKQYFENKPPVEAKVDWKPGQLCTIHFQDCYYRGKIYEVNSPDNITVVMIDFGSDHKLTDNDLYREILYPKIPAFASKIKLDGVYPKSGSWLHSDYETFLDIVSEYCKVIIKSSLDLDIPTAEVFTDKCVNVNQTLANKCPNLRRSPITQTNDSDEDGALIEEVAIVESEEEIIVEVHRDKEDDDKEKVDEEKEAVELASQVDTTKYKYNVLPLLIKDTEANIAVTIMSVLEYNKIALKETSTINDEFYQLTETMQSGVKFQPVIENLEKDMPCVCPYSEDGVWYRAQIFNMEGLDCGYVFVFFVDFGNVESVPVSTIKMMRPEWFDFPVSCHIAYVNIELNCDKNAQHVIYSMKMLYGKSKHAKIISREPLCIHLYELNGEMCYAPLLEKGMIKLK